MPRIADLTQSGETEPTFKPTCSKLGVKKKAKGGQDFVWTVDLVYDVPEEHVTSVVLPPQLAPDRKRMLRAFEKKGVPVDVKVQPKEGVEVDLLVAVAGNDLPGGIERAPAFVKSVALHASPGALRITWVLLVTAGRDRAGSFLDLLDSDVTVKVRANGALPFPGDTGEEGDGEEEENEGDDDEEEEEKPPGELVDLKQPEIDRAGGPVRRRPGRASVIKAAGADVVVDAGGDGLPAEP